MWCPDVARWRLLKLELETPGLNVALDQAILLSVERGKSPATLRFWVNPPSVVIGKHQNAREEVDFEACKTYGVQVVRRFTGGGAVYHDEGNLNWSIIAEKESIGVKSATSAFKMAGEALISGLRALGFTAEFVPPNSVYLKHGKISRMAAYMKRKSLLIHGTLLINADLKILRKVLKNLKVEVANLSEALGAAPDQDAIIEALTWGFSSQFNAEFTAGSISPWEMEEAIRLYPQTLVSA
ncbi:hypothetical protein DRO48_02455 [Candidatus Bathyarchaeota archaeon]|nr:MAG: hypothetical protein DRO48_02455 [Candidatus Bathyarchaeota archaeon]